MFGGFMKNARGKIVLSLLVIFGGFFVGTLMPELLKMGTGSYAGLLSLYSLKKYENASINTSRLYPYILSIRLQTLLFLWMSCYTAIGVMIHAVYFWWLACSAGMLLSLFMLQDGYRGILLFFFCVFPQWLVYASMWKREFLFLEKRRYREIYISLEETAGNGKEERKELLKLVLFCIFGCSVEAFLGTWTLKIFLQIFT